MANPYQPGPAPMPSPPSQGYGWPAQPGLPVGQPNSQFPTARAAKSRRPLDLVAAALMLLALLLDLGHWTWYENLNWLTGWSVVTWIFIIGTSVAGLVLTLMNRNHAAARNTVILAAGIIFIGQPGILIGGLTEHYYSLELSSYGNWLAIPAGLASLAAIILVYIANGSDVPRAARLSSPPHPSGPGWPQTPQQVPGQAPQWPRASVQNPQSPSGFPVPQTPAGYAAPPVYQPVGYPQPEFVPQPQPSVPQQPLYPSPQQPVFGAPPVPSSDPTVLRQPSGPAENQSPNPQPPNPFGQIHDSGDQAAVRQRPGGFGAPPSPKTPSQQQPDPASRPAGAPQPSSAPDASSANQNPFQAGPGHPGTPTPTPPPASGLQQQPPAQ